MAKGELSPSALGTFKDCPRCFWLSKNGVKSYRGIMATLPTAMDEIIKTRHDEYRVKGELPPEIAAQVPGGKPFTDLLKLTSWRTLGKGIRGVLDGVPIMGLLDDLLLYDDGTAGPYDYKTNRSTRDADYVRRYYEHQGDLYEALLGLNGFKTRGKSRWAFYAPVAITNGRIQEPHPVSDVAFHVRVHEVEASAKRASALVKAAAACLDGPLPDPGDDCEMCSYIKTRGKKMNEIVAERKRQEEAAQAAAAQAPLPGTEAVAPAGS